MCLHPKKQKEKAMSEHELKDEYPMHMGYLYIVDGEVYRSDNQMSVGRFKQITKATSVKNCDIEARDLWHLTI
jgi:hypothetical protein